MRIVWGFRLLAAAFLLVAMEEISWGQRIFGWETPTLWSELGTQNETNIHNLLSFHYLNLLYVPGICLIVPTAVSVWVRYRRIESRPFFLVLPHANLMMLAALISFWAAVMVLGGEVLCRLDSRWGECTEELAALFAFSYSIGVFRNEPLGSIALQRRSRRRLGWVLVGCCLAAITAIGLANKYPRLYAYYHGLPHFRLNEKPAPEDTIEINIGTEQGTEHMSPFGWGLNEAEGVTSWAWAIGPGAYIHVHLSPGMGYQMELTVAPLEVYNRVQAITVGLNDHTLGEVELKPGIGTCTVRLPAGLVKGVGKIDFRFRYWVTPLSLGASPDWRPLAVRFFRIRFMPLGRKSQQAEKRSKIPLKSRPEFLSFW
ncbi:hypothetical protein ACFL2Q_19545 [Thermodesulfobacteriota bacterium]